MFQNSLALGENAAHSYVSKINGHEISFMENVTFFSLDCLLHRLKHIFKQWHSHSVVQFITIAFYYEQLQVISPLQQRNLRNEKSVTE